MTTLDEVTLPVTLTPGYLSTSAKTLEVHCGNRIFQDVTVFDTDERRELFRVTGKGLLQSWSWRRHLKDADGGNIYDFRHHSLDIKNRWILEADGKKLAEIEHANQITKAHSAVNMTVFGGHDGKDVVVEMRPLDRDALTTVVNMKGATIAEISLVGANDIVFNEARGKDRTSWKVRIAANVDLTMIMALVLCRAEMAHLWRQ